MEYRKSHADVYVTGRAKVKVLLIELEFQTWARARSWSYIAQLGIEEGFQANGLEYLTIPAIHELFPSSPGSWLRHAQKICAGKHFDQVWVEIVHSSLDETFLEWLATLAPVRVGFLPESIEYTPEEYVLAPNLRGRKSLVEKRFKYLTHVLAGDEKDAEDINSRGLAQAMWWPGAVPERFICEQNRRPPNNHAIFCGALYGERAVWLERPDLRGLFVYLAPPEDATDYPKQFDELNRAASAHLNDGLPVNESFLSAYLDSLRRIRREVFALWLEGLQTGCAVVNLPHYVKSYAGRVFEAMAAGRPVISWEVPNRPRNKALFDDGREILLFNKKDPSQLASHIQRLQNEPDFSRVIAENASRKLRRFHTIENRIRQVLDWIETGKEPDYGELEKDPNTVSRFGHSDDMEKSSEGSSLSYKEKRAFSSDKARQDAYYVNLFTKGSYFSGPDPNEDEKARWSKISSILVKIIQSGKVDCTQKLRILDVGCGRGWLTHLASSYGIAGGVDPAAEVIAAARRYFPNLNFCVGYAKTILTKPDFHPYDVVLASEVIEHVPRAEQAQFVRELSFLTKPGGYVILTTPRAEVFDTWMKLTNHSRQPVDDWLSEEELHRLFLSQGFSSIAQDRIYIEIPSGSYVLNPSRNQRQSGNLLALYQVWGIKMERRPCLREKKECRNTATERPKNPTSTNGWTSRFPVQVHFLMIDKCNAKCIFCGGDYFRSESKRLITLEKFQRMAANLKLERFQKIVLAGAGDPLLNPHLIPIIQYTHDRYSGVGISITTNGIALTEEISEAFLRCKISDLNISINAASRNVYKRVMQVDCFDKVCQNARRFVALRREKGTGPVLQFSSAINRLNIEDLPALVELGREIGIDALNIFYTRFYPERIRHLNVDREEDRLNNQDSLFYHKELSDQMVEKAKSLAEKYGIHFFHEPLFKEYAGPRPCVWPETQLMVGFDGEIYPCGGAEVHFKEKVEGGVYPFGNALTHPIEEFWNGEMYRALRISSQAGKDCPIAECKVCANRMNPGDEKAHIMHWDTPSESTFKKEGERIDKIRKEEPEGEFPLVSVIVPTYNRPDMLVETLRSILNQTYSNYEIIIVNDAGVDVENVVTFLNQAGRMTYVRHGRNLGLAAARNTGIKMAKGKYIAYLDDDDLYYPDHLETLVQFLEGSDYKVAYTDAHRAHQKKVNGRYAVVKQDVPYSFDFDDDRILLENFVPVLCFMHEKSCLDEVGCFDEDLTTQEDWDLWIRLSRKFKFAHIRKVTCEFSWREDGTTMTGGKKIDFLRNMKRIYEKYREYSKGKPNLHQVQETFFKNFDEMVKREYDRIQQLIKESLIEEAISALEKLLILFPAHSLAHDDLGVLYFHRGDRKLALEHFIQSIKADPKNRNAMKNMADLRMELGQMKEALQLYQMVLADQPMDVEALLGVGNYCLRAGRLGDASYFFKQVLEIEPENMAAKEYLDALANPEEEGVSPELRVNGESQPLTALPPKEEKEKIENPKVSIIIPVFNNLCLNRQCLKSIYQNTQDSNYEIIVVDNASTDGTTDFLRHEAAKGLLRVIRNDANLGFAKACNQGAEAARSSYLMFLNNDTEPQKGWLEPLLEILENDPSVAAAGSKLLFPDGKIQHAGVVIIDDRKLPDPLVARHVYYEKPGDYNDANQRRTFQALTAACLLVRKSAFRQAGGFEEEFWNGYEDVDLCFKFQERSWKLVYQPESVVIHHESKSGPERHRRTDENTRLLHRRWLGKIDHDFILKKDGSFTHSNFGFIRPYSLPNRGDEGVLQESESINIPLVSIVILVHNQLEYTKKCIESLFKYTREPFELILVDNGSTDGTLQYLDGIRKGRDDIDGWRLKADKDGKVEGWDGDLKGKGKIKKKKKKKERKLEENKLFCKTIKVIPNERNLGFARGNNQGMAEAKGDYLLLMNNDVVVTPGWLERMIAVAEREPKIGIVGPMSNYVSGPQWIKEVTYDLQSLAGLNQFAQDYAQTHRGQAKPFWRVVGFCMLIKSAVVEKIGGLDSRYGLGNFEDDDFSLRARLAGFESWIAEDCFVHHFGSRTFAGSGIDYSESLKRNWEIFKKKWGIPEDLKCGDPYDLTEILRQGFIPGRHYSPLKPEEYSVSLGEELFQSGDVEGARDLFNRLLQENIEDVDAINNLGVIAYQEGKFDESMSYFNRVLTLNPDHLDAFENLGHCLVIKKSYKEAIRCFEKVLEFKPGDLSLLNSLGNCLIQTGDFLRAEEIYTRSYRLDGTQTKVREILAGLERVKSIETERRVAL
ncbi:MAG: glycosyltransferase [Thermodesulfobacteriota bacterium]|nr:glycosyltransferase [Thermodesulfobacteriota bacterium]